MTVLIDADACPVTKLATEIAKKHGIPVKILCDTNHVMTSDYAEVETVSAGADAVDFRIANLCKKGDVIKRNVIISQPTPTNKSSRRKCRLLSYEKEAVSVQVK